MSSSSYKGKSAGDKPADFYAFLCLGHISAAVDGNDLVEAAAYTVTGRTVFCDGGCDLIFLGDGKVSGLTLEYPVVNVAGVLCLVPYRVFITDLTVVDTRFFIHAFYIEEIVGIGAFLLICCIYQIYLL